MKNLIEKIKENQILLTILVIILAMLFYSIGALFYPIVWILVIKPLNAVLSPELARSVESYLGPLKVFIWAWVATLIVKKVTKGKRDLSQIYGMKRKGNTPGFFLVGLIIGFVMNFTCILMAVLAGNFQLELKSIDVVAIIVMFVGIVIQSSSEELIFRGVFLSWLTEANKRRLPAVIITSVMFTVLHGAVPGFSPVCYCLNFLAWGVLYALSVYYTDGIWLAYGMHSMWNYSQAYLFGLANSQDKLEIAMFAPAQDPVYGPFYNFPFGKADLTHLPEYGPEDTITAPIVMGIAAVIFWILLKRKENAAAAE